MQSYYLENAASLLYIYSFILNKIEFDVDNEQLLMYIIIILSRLVKMF